MQNAQSGVYKTCNYYLASFLHAKGIKVIGLEGQNPRKVFILQDDNPQERKRLAYAFEMGEGDEVSAQKLIDSQKSLQRLLHS